MHILTYLFQDCTVLQTYKLVLFCQDELFFSVPLLETDWYLCLEFPFLFKRLCKEPEYFYYVRCHSHFACIYFYCLITLYRYKYVNEVVGKKNQVSGERTVKKTHLLQSDSTVSLFLVKYKKTHFRSAQASWQQHLDVYNGHPSSLLGMCSSLWPH